MSTAQIAHLARLRHHELQVALPLLPSEGRILEIGAGAGWQSQWLSRKGYEVIAVDLPGTYYKNLQEWPVVQFDGVHLPLGTGSVDAVFTSNVLEHVSDLEDLLLEMYRVLRATGCAVHVIPSSSWRFWTLVGHYPALFFRSLPQHIRRIIQASGLRAKGYLAIKTLLFMAKRSFPPRHGYNGNAFRELSTFSRFRWQRLFKAKSWRVVERIPNQLFYTGYSLLADSLSITARSKVSRLLGSSCNIYCLKKADD